MTCYVERRGVFVRCEVRECGPGDGWELVIDDARGQDGVGNSFDADLDETSEALLPSQAWARRRPTA